MTLTYLLNLDAENPYDATRLIGSPFMPSELSESNLSSWENDSFTNYNDGSCTSMLHTNDDESWENRDAFLCSSTASNKPLGISLSYESGLSDYQQKTVDLWTSHDAVNWVLNVAHDNHLDCEDIHKFRDVNGHKLINMTEGEFISLEPNCGYTLYRDMQFLKSEQGLNHLDSYDIPGDKFVYQLERQEFIHTTTEHTICSQDPTEDCEQSPPKIKRSPGRPRIPGRRNKKQEKKTGRLWEFIRDLLLKPEYCPSLICWEDHDQGIFRFVHSEKVANLWGTLKENPKMTYEKLSRAMRYYYRSKVLQPVLGRRLVYKFGPTATGWRTPNPNFKNNDNSKCKL